MIKANKAIKTIPQIIASGLVKMSAIMSRESKIAFFSLEISLSNSNCIKKQKMVISIKLYKPVSINEMTFHPKYNGLLINQAKNPICKQILSFFEKANFVEIN